MACRLVNLLPTQTLRIDLRGGDVLLIAPGVPSRVLREELLYDNHNVADWEHASWLRRVPARMSEVDPAIAGAFAPLAASAPLGNAPSQKEGAQAAYAEPDETAGSEAKSARRSTKAAKPG